MKKNTCPICDQVMKHPCYCSRCHRIVLHPNVQEVTYYLNERHPQNEEDCLYHGNTMPPAAKTGFAGEKKEGGKTYQGSSVSGAGGQAFDQKKASGNASGRRKRSQTSKSWTRNIVIVFIAAYVLATVISMAAPFLKEAGKTQRRAAEEYTEIQDTEGSEETGEIREQDGDSQNVREFSVEEVQEAGVACSQFGHLKATPREIVQKFLPAVENGDCSVDSDEQTDYNYEIDGVTSYQENYWFGISRYGETAQVQISFDTATKEFHGMVVTGYDEEFMVFLAECAVTALKDAGAVDEDLDFRESFYGAWERDWGARGGYTQMDTLDIMYWEPELEDGTALPNELYLFAKGYFTEE